ncbi:MAG: HupE/UreJ family protein, partial [Acidobacteriota bacterium]
ASAHAISMSMGYATVTGNRVEYLLRMPAYEMTQVKDPRRAVFEHIRFTSGFETGRATGQECHDDAASGNLICAANYEFSEPVERLGVECSFYEMTVPNHIHMLHAERAGKSDQAILDSSFPSATLAFRPPTAAELAIEQSGAGAFRVWNNSAQLLLLLALALAARSRRELVGTGVAFLAGEITGTALILRLAWQPSPRFAEAAVALALAYLAFEMLAFPKSRGRWILALLFGAFFGMYFSVFVNESGYRASWVLAGAAFAAGTVLAAAALAGYALSRLPVKALPRLILTKAAAAALFVTGSVWFYLRLRT